MAASTSSSSSAVKLFDTRLIAVFMVGNIPDARCYLCVRLQYFLKLGVYSIRENVTDDVVLANNDLAMAVDFQLPRPSPVVLNESD